MSLKKNLKIKKDFVNEIISNENKKVLQNSMENPNEETFKFHKELLTEPTLYIRKWIGEV